LANDANEQYNFTLGMQNSSKKMQLWEGEEQRDLQINKAFKVIKDAKCPNPFLLDPEEEELDAFQILINGSLFFTSPNTSETDRIFGTENFCIIATVRDLKSDRLK
jgi:hypothetical protein